MAADYVIRLVCTAMLCGICLSLLEEGTLRQAARLLCGVILAAAALVPFSYFQLPALESTGEEYLRSAQAAAAMGEDLARTERSRIIKQQLQSYIQDKALAMGAQITVDLTLTPEGYPVSARIHGTASPEIRREIGKLLKSELGITEEAQQWIG